MAEAGDVVVCHALECRPHMLVVGADAESLRVVLLADLPRALLQRCCRGDGTAVAGEARQVEEWSRYRVPREDVEPASGVQTRQ
jgi:hypothetical protein